MTRYLLVLAVAMPAALMFRVISALNIAVARPHVVMRMQVAGLALKVVLSYGLIFGALGLPRLGAVGGALASGIVFWALFAAGWAHTRLDPFYHRFAIRRRGAPLVRPPRAGPSRHPDGPVLRDRGDVVHVHHPARGPARHRRDGGPPDRGEPRGASASWSRSRSRSPPRPSPPTRSARRTPRGRGAPRPPGSASPLIAGASLALAVWTLRHPIVRLYTNDAAAAAVALTLVPFLAAFHVFDAVQTAVGFVLRAHKRAVAPTVVYALALWGVGLVGRLPRGLSRRRGGRPGASPACG